VTGSQVVDLLEAAHIKPYRGEKDNNLTNGLLLRADIHTLYDLDLLGIDPDKLIVELHPGIAREYGHLARRLLDCGGNERPSRIALIARFHSFLRRKELPL
jgi:hypothetical protein